jgi:hypothetical protein
VISAKLSIEDIRYIEERDGQSDRSMEERISNTGSPFIIFVREKREREKKERTKTTREEREYRRININIDSSISPTIIESENDQE